MSKLGTGGVFAVAFAACLQLLIPFESSKAIDLKRGPYVLNPTSSSLTVVWETEEKSPSILKYWGLKTAGNIVSPRPKKLHVATIPKLKPASAAKYAVFRKDMKPLKQAVFKTAPVAGSDSQIRFAVIGDTGGKKGTQVVMDRALRRYQPEFVLHLGDFTYPDAFPSAFELQYFKPFRLLIASTPVFPTVGNHDARIEKPYDQAFPTFVSVKEGKPIRYYSFDYGSVHVVSMDSTDRFEADSPQRVWLEQDLKTFAGRKDVWRIVMLHHPPFSDGRVEASERVRQELVPVFEQYNVDLVLSGHVHAYQRSVPLNTTGANEHRVVYLISGGGAFHLSPRVTESPAVAAYAEANHYLGVLAESSRIEFTAYSPDGSVIDSFDLKRY